MKVLTMTNLSNLEIGVSETKMLIAASGRSAKKIKGVNCSIRSVRFAFNSICLVQFSSFDLISSLFGLLRSKLLIVFALLQPGLLLSIGPNVTRQLAGSRAKPF